MSFGAPRHVVSLKCHHDGCRLVHPSKWDIGKFRGAFVTDADWCILSGGSFGISIQFKMSGIDRFVYNSIYHSHSLGFQISHLNSIFTFVLYFQRYAQSMYLFHILIHILIHVLISYTHSCTHFIYSFMYSFHIPINVLISYTHSCTHFIYPFMYSFHSYLENFQILEIRIESENKPIIDSFFSFDTSPRSGCCLYPHLVKYKFFTLSD